MDAIRFGQGLKVTPLYAEEATAAFASKFIRVDRAHWLTFLVNWGAIDTAVTITVEQATASATTSSVPATIKFWYRLLPAVGTDDTTISSASYCASTGKALTASTDNNKAMIIDVDPATLSDTYKYVRVVGTLTNCAAAAFTVTGLLEQRYSKAEPVGSS
jgi:hypothetical protein